jgi:hypothetical protein
LGGYDPAENLRVAVQHLFDKWHQQHD